VLEGRAEAVVGTLNAQGWQTRCGHMRDYGAGAGAGMMRELVGRAEAVAGTLTAQNGANMLACATMGQGDQGAGGACGGGGGHDKRAGLGKHTVAACVFSSFRAHHDGSRLVHTVAPQSFANSISLFGAASNRGLVCRRSTTCVV
jgi:hypothetical protein